MLNDMPENTIYLIPARLESCQVPDILSSLQWVDLFEPDGFENLKRALDFELGRCQPDFQLFEPEMMLIPAGEFLMGSDLTIDKDAFEQEYPRHTLYLPDYSMAKIPVTNAQYAFFVEETGQILDCNPQILNITGHTLNNLKEMKIWEIEETNNLGKAVSDQKIIQEYQIKNSSNELLTMEFVFRKVSFQEQIIVFSIARDMTDRKQAERDKQEMQNGLHLC